MSLIPVEPAAPGSENLIPVEPEAPSWTQVLQARPAQPGLSFISAFGGAARGAGDLLGWRSLADFGGEVARTARGAASDLNPSGMTFGQQAVAGGVDSFGQMLPFMFAGGPALGIAGAGAQQGFSRYSELRDYGFNGGRAAFHAGIDALAEAGGEMLSFPVLFKANKLWLKKGIEFLTKDMVGEELTTLVQGLNAKVSDQPDKTAMSFLDDAIMTAAITPIAGGLQIGAMRAIQGAAAPQQQPPAPGTAPAPAPIIPTEPPKPTPENPDAPKPEPTVAPTPEPMAEPEVPGPVESGPAWMPNSFAVPPDEQLKTGAIDLTLYNELRKGFTVQTDNNTILVGGHLFTEYAPAALKAAELAGVDLAGSPDLLNAAWVDRISKNLFARNPESLSSSTLQFIEGIGIQPVIKSLQNYRNLLGEKATSFIPQLQYAIHDDATREWPNVLQPDGKTRTTKDFLENPAFQVGMTKDSATPMGKTMLARLQAWTKAFGIDTKIVLDVMDKLPDDHGGMLRADVLRNAALLQMNKNKNSDPKTMVTLAHEFGHIIAFDTFSRADAATQLKALKDWATIVRKQGERASLTASVAQGGANRVVSGWTTSKKSDTTADHLRRNRAFADPEQLNQFAYRYNDAVQYITSFQEHLADQVAQYMLDNKMIYTKEEQTLFERIIAKLKAFYDSVVHKYEPNTTFYEYLDTLRSNAAMRELDKPDLEPAAPPIEPDMGKLTTKKNSLIVNEIAPGSIPYWEKRRAKMLKELERLLGEERYDTILEELDPTALVQNFDFERAMELLEIHGADPKTFMSRELASLKDAPIASWSGPDVPNMDETFLARTQLTSLQTAFPGLVTHLTPARESVKSFGKFLRTMLTAVQVRKRYGSEVPAIKKGVDAIELMEAYKAKLRTRADDRVKQMKAVGRAQREKVFGFMIEEDKRGSWLSEAVPNAGNGARMLSPEIAKKFGITEEGAKLYGELRKDFWDALKELEHLRIAQLEKNADANDPQSMANLARNIQAIRDETTNMLAQPYVPHTRFGNYYAQVVDETSGKIQEFYQFESKADAKAWAAKLRKEGKNASAGMLREDVKAFAGLPPSLVQSMRDSLDLTEEQARQFEDIIKNMSGGQSFVRKMKKRKDIPGWTEDEQLFPQVYADYMTKFANHAGRLKFNGQLKQSELDLKQMIRDEAMAGRDTTNLGQLLNWLQATNSYALNPTSEWANMRGAVTLWYLGFGVKSAVVNGLSVPMVTYPYLAKRFGDAKAIAAIGRAYSDLARNFTKPNAMTDDEKKMLEALRQQNVLDESYSAELAGLREGGTLADTMDFSPKAAWSSAKYYGMWMFHKMEVANRHATALSAYRLARTQLQFNQLLGPDAFDQEAMAFAKSAIQDTQNVNAQWNRAEYTRGGKSVLTMFMSYQQNLIFQMFGGDQSWLRLLAAQLLVAGAMGLPLAKDADNLIKWFSRKVLGEDFSVEQYLREMLSGLMDNPNWVLRGGSYNVFGTDLQGSLGLGQVIPGLDALAMEGSFAERLANAAPDIGGPAAATMISFMQAMADNNPDPVARFSRALPAFAKQASQGWTMFNEGVAKNGQGDPIVEVSKQDALKKILGFQPTDVSQESAKRFAQKDTARYWLAERQYVMEIYYHGVKNNDPEMRAKAIEALHEYNSRIPNQALAIGGKDLKQSLAARLRSDQQAAQDMPAAKRDRILYQDMATRY